MKMGLIFQEITFITELPGSNFLLPKFFLTGGKWNFKVANLLLATANLEPCYISSNCFFGVNFGHKRGGP